MLRARENPARRRLVETESLETWLAARGLAALTDTLADIADDPDDLREMTDDDVVEALEAVADADMVIRYGEIGEIAVRFEG